MTMTRHDGTTGATPLLSSSAAGASAAAATSALALAEEAAVAAGGGGGSPLRPLVEALSPFAQLVQGALNFFEDRGIRHEGDTYRPLQLSATTLRKIELCMAAQRGQDDGVAQAAAPWSAGALANDIWLTL